MAKYCIALMLACLIVSPVRAAWQTADLPTDTLADATSPAAPGITTTVSDPYFNITAADVNKAVAEQLALQAIEKKLEVSLSAGSPNIIYSANHPMKLVIHSLQVDTQSRRWQAQAYVLMNGKTETVKPVSGVYVALVDVPVLKRQLGRNDVIEAADLGIKSVPDRLLRKDTISDPSLLIGQSPRAVISADRPIRHSEVSSPVVVKRGEPVQMTYTNAHMSIKTTGIALQDGAKGEMIRIKNDKSEKSVSGRVVASGHIEVNTTPTL